ncbi:flavodoxin family protein [Pseudorhodoplanes sp.]|uniref:flavodoxin family protein n=1 Tax=Pseudorhodoplanes sp. TaxID=1934341 RepID=UPI002CC2BCD0|nr:flavodoxin family protein [Pseudorhodoplanes sp.]HWV53184.1 flavodoxin family protein [Pseudorhodoplanes sp.]
MANTDPRTGMPSVALSRDEFVRRFKARFYDPLFEPLAAEIDRIADAAWTGYSENHKSPRTKPAGAGYADPAYELSDEWRAASEAVASAQARQQDKASPSRILIVNGSSRSDQTCPGEISKTWRLAKLAQEIVDSERGFESELLDLSRLASEYGRVIYPCKSCVSTAMPLCHWPCSCYPNHAIGQTGDWMAEIYPKWVAAHGVMVLCPVNWYQVPSSLKLMIDRLVCADGGNPDPTSTQGKSAKLAKEIELDGWSYPRHLAGRVYSVVAHGDASGVENLRRILSDWLSDIGLIPAGHMAEIDRYIGYYEPYATSHAALDADIALQDEVRNCARALIEGVRLRRSGELKSPDRGLREVRPK